MVSMVLRTVIIKMYCTTTVMWGMQNFLTLKRVILETDGNHRNLCIISNTSLGPADFPIAIQIVPNYKPV